VAAEVSQADSRRRVWVSRGPSAWARAHHEAATGCPPGRSDGRAISKDQHTQSLPLLRGPGVPATPATPAMMRQEEERAATPVRFPCCPTKQQLHSSASGGALPELPRRANQPFPSLAAKVRDLGCGDRVALSAKGLMAGAVQTAGIEEVDFGGNLKLDEYQLSMLMASLCDEGASANLRRLSLRRCAGVGMGTLSSIIRMLSSCDTTPKLRHLDLSGVQIGMKSHRPLCRAIKEHSALKDVRLADAGLGSGIDVKGCVGDLLASTSLRMLDLSWNCFSADIFSSLGEKLAENQNLRSLNLSNCAATNDAADVASPAACFIEHLSRDRCLQRLDLSLNRIDFRAALCLEDAMGSNRTLEQLDLSNNPLGVDGIRSALRMLTRDGSGLNRLICEGCSKGFSALDEYPWEPTHPGVRYNLDLERPQDRTLLRMILKLCDRLGAQATSCMLNVVSTQKYKNPQGTDSWGLWDVPRKGKLSFTLSIAKMLEGQLGTASDWKGDTVSWLQRQSDLLRLSLSRKKEHLLIGFWRQCHGMVDRQQLVLTAISRDFSITYPQLLSICKDEDDHLSSFLLYLLPCLGANLFSRYLALGKTNNLPSCVALFRRSQKLLAFNPESATGHYHLDLENACEHMVAQQMVILDSWETLIDQQVGRADTSQRGNRSHFRNEKHLNVPLQAASVAEWPLPPSGVFEFDYVSSRRPALDAPELSQDTLNSILRTLTYVSCSSQRKLACLRQVADQVFLRAMQLREIMGLFKDDASRADLFVIFCLRLTDSHNRKLVMTRLETPAVVSAMLLRVGHATFFPFIQPEQAFFELDLLYHDQRLCLNMYCVYSFRERPENLRDVQYMRPDGTLEKLELGVPRSWEQLSRVPTTGVVRGRYVCAPESRKFQMRKEFTETYGFWNCRAIGEADVRWWYTMSDVPADVIIFISYIMSQWDVANPSEVYPIIVKNKPFFAFSTFEEAFSKRFCTDGDNTRLKELFRYFDATGDGRVSLKEWCILDHLWNEIRLSVQELAQFLERTFQAQLEDTWIFFDKDGSGTVTDEEWTRAVMSLGYYGPLKMIFAYLDHAERGVLHKQAFAFMKNFRQGILAFSTAK